MPEECVAEICAFYAREEGAPGREEVERMLDGSTEVVVAIERGPDGSGRLVGFTRAISDGAFRAFVFDVLVATSQRSSGLNVRLLRELLGRPSIAACRRVDLLSRPEMVAFHERFGFEAVTGGLVRMERHRS